MKLYTHECKGLADGCTAYIAGSSNGVRYLRVQNPANRTSAMVLKAYENSDIEDDGIIAVHPIVAKLLQVDHGGSCVVEDVGTLTSPTPETHQAVTVRFISYQSTKHWDEFSLNTSPLMLYGQWQTKWPSSIPVQVVESMMPTMLLSACLCPGHRFVLHLSDNYLVFEVDSTANNQQVLVSTASSFSIVRNSTSANNDNITTSKQLFGQFDFTSNVEKRLDYVIQQILSPADSNSLSHSILISAPSGAGKSRFLESFYERATFQLANKATVLKASCTNINRDQLHKLSTRDTLPDTSDWLQSVKVLHQLLFASQIDAEGLVAKLALNGKILMIVDDMDLVLEIFVDEDKISGSNLSSSSGHDPMKVLAYHFYNIMRRDQNNHQIIIIATTRLAAIDLPRSNVGAPDFETVVSIHKLSRQDRQHILHAFLKEYQGSLERKDVNKSVENNLQQWSEELAAVTRGYLPGDLKTVVGRGVLLARGKQVADQEQLYLTWKTMLNALASTSVKSLQEWQSNPIASNEPETTLTWRDFPGYDQCKESIKKILKPLLPTVDNGKSLIQSLSIEELSEPMKKMLNYRTPRGMVLHGPSGCGKTLLAKIIAKELGMNMISVYSTDLLSKYFGQTEEKIRKIFQVARNSAPCMIFFDDFDALAHKRGRADQQESSHGNLQNRVLSTFLNELDGIAVASNERSSCEEDSAVFILAACKDLSNLDEALVRPGRLQYHIALSLPIEDDIRDIFDHFLSKMKVVDDLEKEDILAVLLNNRLVQPTAATIQAMCNQAQFEALKDFIEQHQLEVPDITPALIFEVENNFSCDLIVKQLHFDRVMMKMFIEPSEAGKEDLLPTPESSIASFASEFKGGWTFNAGV